MKTNVVEAFSGEMQLPGRSEAELRILEEAYCSHGDTVHYTAKPKFFEECEGFESREAEARLVERDVHLNKLEFGEQPCWAQLSDLEALGFEILSRTPNLRTVGKGAETFVEGYLESEIVQTRDDLAEAAGRGRPHGTRRQGKPN